MVLGRAGGRGAGRGLIDTGGRMLFLVWLADRGVLRAEDVVEVIRAYTGLQRPIGRIAREEGLMSMKGVMEVLAAQADRPGTLFGELAVELGYLDTGGLLRLMHAQASRAPRYDDVLLSLGLVSAADLSEARQAFVRACEDGDLGPRAVRSTSTVGAQ